jgi:hypothetical protein
MRHRISFDSNLAESAHTISTTRGHAVCGWSLQKTWAEYSLGWPAAGRTGGDVFALIFKAFGEFAIFQNHFLIT